MKITKYEQSGFIIERDNGYKIAIDIGSYTPTDKLNGIIIDLMLVSHIHGDHFSIEHLKRLSPKKVYLNEECIDAIGEQDFNFKPILVSVGDHIEVDGIKVVFFDVDHGPNVKIRPKENFGFLIEIDGKKIYFAGDMFNQSGIDVSNLAVDVVLIPIGTFYTFGPKEAVDFAKKFRKIEKIIPMHYQKTPETRSVFVDLAIAEGFNVDSQII